MVNCNSFYLFACLLSHWLFSGIYTYLKPISVMRYGSSPGLHGRNIEREQNDMFNNEHTCHFRVFSLLTRLLMSLESTAEVPHW